MALHPSGFLNQAVELLRVKTNLFDLYILGKPFHPTVETLKLHRDAAEDWVDATLNVVSRHHLLRIHAIQVFSPVTGEMMDANSERILPCFYETQTYQLVIENKSSHTLEFFHDHIHLRQAIKPLGRHILSGMLNFQNEIGYTDLAILLDGAECLKVQLEIFPTKLDYKSDYQAILQDVNQQIYNLSFDFMRKTYHLTGLKETNNQSLTEFFAILQHVFQQLVDAIERIKDAPHTRLFSEHKVTDAAKVKRAGRENIAFLTRNPHYLIKDDGRGFLEVKGTMYRPQRLIETKRKLDYDTGENRFLRWVLLRIETKLKQVHAQLNGMDHKKDSVLLDRMINMQGQLRRLLQIDFLRDVGTMRQMSVSLVLQMAPGYRDAYRMYLMLMKGLSIQSDLFHLSMKDMAQLYEYWCFLKIHGLLSRKYKLLKQDIIRINRNGLFVKLDRTQEARVEYENPANGERFELYYNTLPLEDKKIRTTLAQRPDNVLTLRKHEANQQHKVYKYVFDAKYRLNPAYEGTPYHGSYQGLPGPEEEDINTMHRYRDAIVYQDKGSENFERSMFGAYVLFPYGDEEKFKQHRFYKSIELVNIGAFPFLPKATGLMEKFLDELIMDSPEKAFERSTRPRGSADYYQNKLGSKNVLVGSLKDKSQLDFIKKQLFYHTPLNNITDHKLLTQLEYVAIYQSKNWFGADGQGVYLYGKITDWQVLKREQIKERPAQRGTEHRLYVKFVVEEWLIRETPILSGGVGVRSCMLTTKYMFDRAYELAELKLDTEAQLQEWREKRRHGRVKVQLDHADVDVAKRVLGIKVVE
ncbi:restriction endonuclease-like protein [Paenibacillus sp. WQ 127069]|uniref:Restriction endonuclease-like protein n=1 Tax=Paenibacillus baimaensis TaxID=2982185 RepID=A0ABT2UCW5_9BACL|nr:restriction endonuclease-like protein [Paenibacillus sp. WQ 127069]MCU6792469.1 restriction endonuclease-like protein [Paenibacillus sp. WQ 127069]